MILDSRLVSKSYGKAFLNSLPETIRVISDKNTILERMEDFIVLMREGE